MAEQVHLQGMRELRTALKILPGNIDKDFKRELKDIAQSVADKARGKVPVLTGAAAASVKAGATAKGAYVKGGNQGNAQHFGWLDFGGRVGIRNSISRPRAPEGRYIFPTAAEEQSNIHVRAEALLGRTFAKAGF